ncbi:MAG TPA: AAA family ATPase [Kofleriaceae bacterium]|nr:AAA family ATPase [Kofleriaceae bacterium]
MPAWAEELRRRYLRGEASVFVLYGNVHDRVLRGGELVAVSEFVAREVLEKKEVIIHFNVSTGVRFIKKSGPVDGLEDLLVERAPSKVLPVLEHLLFTRNNVGLLIDYVEMLAPAGDASFSSEQDRLAAVTLQRWSMAPELEASDNVVILLTDAPSELHQKIVSNPRVAAVKVPMPDRELRRQVVEISNRDLDREWCEKLADLTAGLKAVQVNGILQAPPASAEDVDSRARYIKSLIGDEKRARKLAAVTQGMSREEVNELVGVTPKPAAGGEPSEEMNQALALLARRKREIIERECFGLVEFVEPAHDFSVVGGMDEIKRELGTIARNIRDGRTSRVPMGLLFTGPMGTGKTFVAEAFVRESGLTGIKLKNFRSKWVGSTESNLEKILDVVRAIGNIIVIIDEGDRSFGSGGEGGETDGGTGSRVIARLKEFMSDTSNRGRVLFILMTNRPDKLDVDIKRAGRLDRKIPFLYAQTAPEVEAVLVAQLRKHKLVGELEFPRDRAAVSERIVGYSNADIEAVALLAHNMAAEQAGSGAAEPAITVAHFEQAIADYLPPHDVAMLEYMELLAVFEASSRRMLPQKYAGMSMEELQRRLAELKIVCGDRR